MMQEAVHNRIGEPIDMENGTFGENQEKSRFHKILDVLVAVACEI
jgi:hypothetical protein